MILRKTESSPVLALLGALLLAPHAANAESGDTFFETMGFGIAMGTVLGASTLPFYEQPGEHAGNLLTGALIGAAGGLILAISDSGPSVGREEAVFAPPLKSTPADRIQGFRRGQVRLARTNPFQPRVDEAGGRNLSPVHASGRPNVFWTPLVSLTW